MNSDKKVNIKAIFSITALYFLGNFLLLLNRGFWSDGIHLITELNDKNYPAIWTHLGQFKSYALYYMIQFLIFVGGNTTLLIKTIGFLDWLIAGIALYIILRKVIELSDRDSFFVSAFFFLTACFPYKGELGYLHFITSNMLFFLTSLMFFLTQANSKKIVRVLGYIASVVLFFVSFTTNSILVFYYGFLLVHFSKFCQKKKNGWRQLIAAWIKQNWFLIILPFIYWFYQLSLGKPYGELGTGYNSFVIFRSGPWLSNYFLNIWNFIVYGFFWPLVAPIAILNRRIFAGLLLIILPIVYFLTKDILYTTNNESSDHEDLHLKPRYYILSGVFWFALGAFPYLAVGDFPIIFGNFQMRYGILLPLGSSLIILGVILGVIKEKWQPYVQVTIISLFIVFNIYNYYNLDMDWYRQKAVMLSLRETKFQTIKDASTLVFHDEYPDQKMFGRGIKTSEYELYLHEADPNNFKWAYAISDAVGDIPFDQEIVRRYQQFVRVGIYSVPSNFNPIANVLHVAVESLAGHETMTVATWLKIKKAEIFSDQATYQNTLKNELQIEVIPFIPSKLLIDVPQKNINE